MKKLAIMILMLSISTVILTGCTQSEESAGFGNETSEIVSETVSEETTETTEASENTSESTSEVSETVPEEEPTIVNDVLTFEETQVYIENLKTMYPNMKEEEIVALFVNFNIHSLDADTIDYYNKNYNCWAIHNMLYDKFNAISKTYGIVYQGKEGIEYKDYWSLTDFVTNEQVKIMAQELEEYLKKIAYTPDDKEYDELKEGLYNYMIGENDCFTFDYASEQRKETDLDGICYFVARYNDLCNQQNLGYNEDADICPIERYEKQMY